MPNERKKITPNQDAYFYAEVEGLCPLCGKALMLHNNRRMIKQYEIAHIYPCNPTLSDLSILSSIPSHRDGESYENKIALCLDCHNDYDNDKTLDKFKDLQKIKKRLIEKGEIQKNFSSYDLEEEINFILSNLQTIEDYDIEANCLNLKALKIKEKLEDKYSLLRREIESNATKYFIPTQKLLKSIDTGKFTLIASQVKSFYLKSSSITKDKNLIYSRIVEWIKTKSNSDDDIACSIVVSYFVQDCEVFDAIAK